MDFGLAAMEVSIYKVKVFFAASAVRFAQRPKTNFDFHFAPTQVNNPELTLSLLN